MPHKKIAVLTSGGLDSAILIHSLIEKGDRVWPVYVRSGHLWENAEIFWLKRFLKKVKSPRLKPLNILSCETKDLYGTHWGFTGKNVPKAKTRDEAVYIPGKNLLLIAKAAVFCALHKIPNLALAPLATNPFPDATPEFFKSMARASSKGLGVRLKISAPFLRKTKREVMALGQNLPLELTFSCIAPKKLFHCGCCNKCAERKKAFQVSRLIDRTRYAR